MTTHTIKAVTEVVVSKRDKYSLFGDYYLTRGRTYICICDNIHVDDFACTHVAVLDYLIEGGVSRLELR